MEIVQSEWERERSSGSCRDCGAPLSCGRMPKVSIRVIGVPEREQEEETSEKILERSMTKNSPNFDDKQQRYRIKLKKGKQNVIEYNQGLKRL